MEKRAAALWMALMVIIAVALNVLLILKRQTIPFGLFTGIPYITAIIVMVVAFFSRFKLTTMPGDPENVLKDLAHRLRISGYRVDHRRGRLVVQVSSITSINVRAKSSRDGTLISYWAGATPSGWSLMIISTFIFFPLAIAVAIAVFYKSVVFATKRVLPRLSQLPIGEEEGDRQVRALLIDSLAEGRRLSAEAYEAAHSNYEDVAILLGAAAVIASLVAGVLIVVYVPERLGGGSPAVIPVFLVAGLVIFVVAFRSLSRKRRPALKALRRWSETLEAALNREVAKLPPSDGDPSSFELIGESCRMIPDWLGMRKRGGRFREPGDWLVIGILAFAGCMMLVTGILVLAFPQTWHAGEDTAAWAMGVGSAFLAGALLVYVRWKRRESRESATTIQDWSARCKALKSNLQDLLEDV